MYAVVRSGGKQYRVSPGGSVRVEKLDGDVGAKITLEEVLMIGGEGVFRLFGAPTPNWYGGFKENKMFAFGCVWMANNIAAGMVATGAFEIVVGDRTIYSKLETGRLPNAKDVIDGLKRVGLTTPLEAKYLGTAPRSEL